jgi:O-antigen/teichoic acid export membrane protein
MASDADGSRRKVIDVYSTIKQRVAEVVTPRVSTRTLQQGLVLMAANMAGSLLQYLFHFFSSRMLGPVDYGVFTALLGLSVILTVPAGIAQTMITQFISGFYARNESGRIAALFADAMGKLSWASVAAFGVIAVASPLIAAFLNIPSIWPVIAMASLLLLTGQFTTFMGTFQGLQRFYLVAAQSLLGPGFRLVAGVLLISVGFGASGALGATTVSNLLVVAIGFFFVRDLWGKKGAAHGLSSGEISAYGGIVFLGTLGFTVLTNIDLVVVKHFFSPVEAGYYSAASVLGKIILFVPGAVSTVMFPKTSYRRALGQSASDVARKSMLISAGLCALGVTLLALFPAAAVHALFGGDYEASIPLVGLYGVTMGLYGMVQLLLAFYISQAEARFAWLLVAVTVLLALFLAFVHATLMQVIVALAVAAVVLLLVSEFWLQGLGLVGFLRATSE